MIRTRSLVSTTRHWFSLFTRIGFEVTDYREPRAEPGEDDVPFHVARSWAARWPSEQAWFLRKPV